LYDATFTISEGVPFGGDTGAINTGSPKGRRYLVENRYRPLTFPDSQHSIPIPMPENDNLGLFEMLVLKIFSNNFIFLFFSRKKTLEKSVLPAALLQSPIHHKKFHHRYKREKDILDSIFAQGLKQVICEIGL
jgi:hypothetical protein